MGSRYRKPEETRLELDGGDWLLVRKYLTAGESRDSYVRLLKDGKPGELDANHIGIALIAAYLIDWSITDADDRPVVVRDASYDFVYAALRNMEPASLMEILNAIQAHEAAMLEERDRQKKTRAGSLAPDPTSTSVA